AQALLRDHPDAVVVFGVGNAVFCRFFRWSHVGVAINVDGADWARLKWGPIGRRYLRWSERVAVKTAGAVIADSKAVAAYYQRQLRTIAPDSVIFTGYQFGAAYHELSAHAYAFLFGAQVGGTHPVLVEQLAHGNCVLARWTDSNAEVAADAAVFFHDLPELQR